MADSSFSMVFTESAAVFGSCDFDAAIKESKEAGFMVPGPWEAPPAAGCLATGLAGGMVLPPQYIRAVNATADAMVM